MHASINWYQVYIQISCIIVDKYIQYYVLSNKYDIINEIWWKSGCTKKIIRCGIPIPSVR